MSYSKTWELSRRTALRGMGVTMALPFLEAMLPGGRASAAAGVSPVRFAGFFMPNGVDHSRFTPKHSGLSSLPFSLEPLEGLQPYVNVITGMNNAVGGHAAGTSAFLTGQNPKRTAKANEVNVKNPSLDQIIGNAAKKESVLPTLELGLHTPRSGVSMSGHSHIYTSFISWKSATTPVPHEINPMRAFDRLFKGARVTSSGGRQRPATPHPDKSVIDAVLEDAKSLQKRLGKSDQQKLDEYFTAVRDVEERITFLRAASNGLVITPRIMKEIEATGSKIGKAVKGGGGGSYRATPNIPYREHGRLMMDVMALAFWSNSTRASTLMFGDGLNGRNMSFLDGVDGNHHSISHHGNKKENLRKFSLINRFFVEQYAYFLKRLESMEEGGSNVLENSVVMLGTNLSSGQVHGGNNVPVLLAGNAGGRIRGNRHIRAKGEPVAKLHRSVLDKMNIKGTAIRGGDKSLREI